MKMYQVIHGAWQDDEEETGNFSWEYSTVMETSNFLMARGFLRDTATACGAFSGTAVLEESGEDISIECYNRYGEHDERFYLNVLED